MGKVKRNNGVKVKPMRTLEVRAVAHEIRDSLLKDKHYVDVCRLYEVLEGMELLTLEIVEEDELEVEATTDPDTGRIVVREDIYNGAADGVGHCRFTMAHELGHLFLHKGQKPEALFARGKSDHDTWRDSEWQADVYASELLMDSRLIDDLDIDPEVASERYGLSLQAAKYKLYLLKKEAAKNEKSHQEVTSYE